MTCLVAHAGAQQESSNRSATFPVLALLPTAWEIPENGQLQVLSQALSVTFQSLLGSCCPLHCR